MQTRLENNIVQPKQLTDGIVRYSQQHCAFLGELASHRVALSDPQWRGAMEAEFDALQFLGHWDKILLDVNRSLS